MFKNYLKTTFRNLWKNKTYSFLNIFGLGVGIACAALIFLWVENEMTYNAWHSKKNYIYQLMGNQAYDGKTYTFAALPGPLAQGIKEEIPGIKNACRATWPASTLFSLDDKSIYESGIYADSSLFSIFTFPFVQGKPQNAFAQLHSLMISETLARKFFGNDKNVLGKVLKVDNRQGYTIGGVFKDLPENSSLKFDWVIPFAVYAGKNEWLKGWNSNGIQTYVELDAAANTDTINQHLNGYIQTKDKGAIARPLLLSMADWRLRNNFVDGKQSGGRIEYVRMFSIIAWIVLLIACINFMNLATARSEKRAREVGVRKVLGAGRKMLVGQFIAEAILMSFLAVLLSLSIIYLALPGFNLLVKEQLTPGLDNPWHIVALISIALVCGLVSGSYPALYLSSFNPVAVFKSFQLKSSTAAYTRKGLVVFQFTISIVLIISTIIIFRQIQHVKNRELGYSKDNLIQINTRGSIIKHFAAIKQDLLGTGAVENVALADLDLLWMGSNSSGATWQGKDPNKEILITMDAISPEYVSTAGLKLVYGRDFYPVAGSDSLNIIINESLAKLMGKENQLGKTIKWGGDSVNYSIVGIVKDFIYGDMYGKSDPLIFFSNPRSPRNLYIKLKPQGNTEQALAKIATIMKANNPGYPFDYKFVDDQFNDLFKSEMLIGTLSRVFAALAIIISCLGLFGLAAYTAERRTREIGIRKVLGASVQGITALLSKDFLQLVFLSALLAFPLAWWAMHSWLQNYAYRITISWWVFVAAGAVALLIALITISFQAIRAAVANPVKSLRSE